MLLPAYYIVILIHLAFIDFVRTSNKIIEPSEHPRSNVKVSQSDSSNLITVGRKVWDCREFDACSDQLGFEAILLLHQRLDDDANGNVDISESEDFLRGELNYDSSYERQKGFHRNDKHITADELWLTWKSSEVHNWTIEDTVQWLTANVELPQYAKNFNEKSIDGTALPRMAVNNMHYLSHLGIKDPIHKQKISLKAMDVVLFGPSKNHNYLKDIIVTLSLIAAVSGVYFGYTINKKSQAHMKKTMKDMESLQHAEEALIALQRELDQAKIEQEIVATEKKDLERRLQHEITTVKHQDSTGSSTDDQSKIQRLQDQLKSVLADLHTAERALQEKSWVPAPALQHWLQLTYELELQHYNMKKAAAERQLASAKEGCEKLRKKRSSFLGTFRVAHGSSIDDVDNRILQAKAALSEVTIDLQERLHRWKQIEVLCGFSIVHNPGLHNLENLLGTTMLPSKSSFSRMTRTNSEGTLDDEESLASYPAGISARSLANIPYMCSSRPSLTIGQRVPSPDLKSCSSSSAILQRSDAVCYDHSDVHSSDGMDSELYNERIGAQGIQEHSRPIFTLGEGSANSGVKQRGQHIIIKSNKGIDTVSTFQEICSDFAEAGTSSINVGESVLDGKLLSSTFLKMGENHASLPEKRDVKRKIMSIALTQKAKTS